MMALYSGSGCHASFFKVTHQLLKKYGSFSSFNRYEERFKRCNLFEKWNKLLNSYSILDMSVNKLTAQNKVNGEKSRENVMEEEIQKL